MTSELTNKVNTNAIVFVRECSKFITELAGELKVNQLCTNTAIVMVRKFCLCNPGVIQAVNKSPISTSSVFLASKIEDQPRPLRQVIEAFEVISDDHFFANSDDRKRFICNVLMFEELILLCVGFNVDVAHPQPFIAKFCALLNIDDSICRTAYFIATLMMSITDFALQHNGETLACIAVHLACLRHHAKIPQSSDGKHWWQLANEHLSTVQFENLCKEFIKSHGLTLPSSDWDNICLISDKETISDGEIDH